MGQLVELALRPARIRNVRQHIQQRRKRSHGNLPTSCRRRSQTLPGSGTPLRSDAYFAPCMQQSDLSTAHPAALNSPVPSPPNSAANCRAARSRAAEDRCPLRPPPRTSRRRNCRAAARTRLASASSDSAAASSSNSAGDSRAAIWVMSPSSGAGLAGAASVFLTNPFRAGLAARAFCAMGLGTVPNRSGCCPSTTGPRVTSEPPALHHAHVNGEQLKHGDGAWFKSG